MNQNVNFITHKVVTKLDMKTNKIIDYNKWDNYKSKIRVSRKSNEPDKYYVPAVASIKRVKSKQNNIREHRTMILTGTGFTRNHVPTDEKDFNFTQK